MEDSLDDKIRTLQKVKAEIGLDVDFDIFLQRFNQLNKGLIHEDEFLFLLAWTGRCRHFNKLDQSVLLPGSKEHYTVPDVMVVLDVDGEEKTFLIEIKTTTEKKWLKWTKAYYEGLINYAKLFNAEVLVAWKWSALDIWTLFEMRHFTDNETSYRITLEMAHQQNLTGKLLGDYLVFLADNVELIFRHKKNRMVSQQGNTSTWETVIEEIYYTVNGERIPGMNNAVFKLFLTSSVKVEVDDHPEFFLQRYSPDGEALPYAQSIVIGLAKADQEDDTKWIDKIRKGKYPGSYDKLWSSFMEARDLKLIQYVAVQRPLGDNDVRK